MRERAWGGEHAKISLRTDITVARYAIFKRNSYEFSQLAAWPCGSAFFWAFTDWTTLEAARPGQFDIGRRARRQAKLCALLLARGGACRSFHESFHALSLLSTLGLTLLHHIALTLSLSLSIPFSIFRLIHTHQTFSSLSLVTCNPLPLSLLSHSTLRQHPLPPSFSPCGRIAKDPYRERKGQCVQFRSQ